MYLGDGHITVAGRSACLWVYCADAWPGIRAEVESAVASVLSDSPVSVVQRNGCVAVKSHSRHWLCCFPQHGPGPKHARPIELEPWQREVVADRPGQFLRGLIHSDGCRITNWTRRMVAGEIKRYEYPRYMFSNESADVMILCRDALDRLGIAHRMARPNLLSVARRTAVAMLDQHVGPKF